MPWLDTKMSTEKREMSRPAIGILRRKGDSLSLAIGRHDRRGGEKVMKALVAERGRTRRYSTRPIRALAVRSSMSQQWPALKRNVSLLAKWHIISRRQNVAVEI